MISKVLKASSFVVATFFIASGLQAEEVAREFTDPTVYIVPLGQEMNLKVSYDHPMDHAGMDFIEFVRMESPTGEFLGLKTFSERDDKAYAEFVINPQLAGFDSVNFVAKSTTLGEKHTTSALELTPEDQLPDEINPRKIMEKRLEAAKARAAKEAGKSSYGEVQAEANAKAGIVGEEVKEEVVKEVKKEKKKKSGWFGG